MTKHERNKRLKEAKSIGGKELYREVQVFCNYKEVLDVASNPKDFKKIWEGASDNTKLLFIKDAMKYVLKEKGKETEGSEDERNKNSTRYDEMVELANKLNSL